MFDPLAVRIIHLQHRVDRRAACDAQWSALGFDAAKAAHFDALLPGRVRHIPDKTLGEHRVAGIRRLRGWETGRAVQPPRSKQLRQPICKGSADGWCQHATWLLPMRGVLGELVDARGHPVHAP